MSSLRYSAPPFGSQATDSYIRVVDFGASLVAEDGHEEAYLIRAFPSLEAHREQEETFYSSDAWRLGPREAIVSRSTSPLEWCR